MENEYLVKYRLNNILHIIFSISFLFFILSISLALIINKIDLFIFVQIFVYPFLFSLIIIFYQTTQSNTDSIFLTNSILCSLAIRCVMVIIIYLLLWSFQGGPFQCGWIENDDLLYHKISLAYVEHPKSLFGDIYSFGISERYALYPYFVSCLYKFSYPHTLVARFANAILGSIAIIPFYYFIKNLGIKKNIAKLATSFYIFSPGFIYFGSLQLKDTLSIVICFTLLYLGSLILKIKKISNLAFLTLIYFSINWSLFYIRAQFFFLFAFFYLLFFFYSPTFSRKSLLFIPKLLLIIPIGFFIYQKALSLIAEDALLRLAPTYIFHEFMRYSEWHTASMLGPLMPIVTSITGFFLPFPTLMYLPYSNANYPTSILKLPLDVEIFFTSMIVIFVIFRKGIVKHINFRILLVMALFCYFGLVISNFITYERAKLLLTSFSFIFVAFGVEEESVDLKKVLFGCFIATLVIFFYNIMRGIAHGVV